MAEEWDLSAVVRSCTSATNTTTSNTYINTDSAYQNANFENPLDCLATLTFGDDEDDLFSFPDLLHQTSNGGQELQDSYMPFLPNTTDQSNILGSSISDFGGVSVQNQPQLVQQQQKQPPLPPPPLVPPTTNDIPFTLRFNSTQQQKKLHQQGRSHQRPDTTTSVLPLRTTQSQAPSRSRKKKNHLKRQVMQVTAENLCNDVWAWRKYGQKPIKGSPYPRNYYRCSSSKGCAARKQVERSNTDPNMFIISYTGDHTHPRPTHRNSLAGSTRNKFPTTIQKPAASMESEAPSGEKEPCSSPLSVTSLSPTTPLSAPMVHDAPNENINTVAGNIDGADLELESDGDGDGDGDGIDYEDDDDILIPNMVFNEDLIKGLQELGSTVGEGPFGGVGSTRNGGLGHSPDFGDNFSSWSVGSSTAAAAAGAGSATGGD